MLHLSHHRLISPVTSPLRFSPGGSARRDHPCLLTGLGGRYRRAGSWLGCSASMRLGRVALQMRPIAAGSPRVLDSHEFLAHGDRSVPSLWSMLVRPFARPNLRLSYPCPLLTSRPSSLPPSLPPLPFSPSGASPFRTCLPVPLPFTPLTILRRLSLLAEPPITYRCC